ncbi:hypothetical protein [Faecalicatena orotica]|uniref:hypothetical protein n=1 Tax=Faecalicatena orotica TaxID=1544 RepID=UPI003218067D
MKKKLEYFWTYYKSPFLIILAVSVIAGHFIYAAATEKESAFTAYMFDAHAGSGQDTAAAEFAEFAGIDTSRASVTIDASFLLADSSAGNYTMTSLAKFYTEIGTEELDACMMTEETFKTYAGTDAFLDLRSCLSEKQIERYRESFVYEKDVPVGIRGNEFDWIRQTGGYEENPCIFGIVYNSGHVENAVKFLEYLDGGNKK